MEPFSIEDPSRNELTETNRQGLKATERKRVPEGDGSIWHVQMRLENIDVR